MTSHPSPPWRSDTLGRVHRAAAVGFALVLALAASPSAHALTWPDVAARIDEASRAADVGARRAAARDLLALGRVRATPIVLKLLVDADPDVRVLAAQAAATLAIREAVELVQPWLGDREVRLRIAACNLVRVLPDAKAIPALSRALGDGDPLVRTAAAAALAAQAHPDAVAPLLSKLDDPAPTVRVEIVRALARLGDSRSVVPLIGKVQDSVPEVRQAIARALGQLGDARATQALLILLRDNSADVRVDALSALAALGPLDAIEPISVLAVDRAPNVRQAAIAALGRIPLPEAVRALVALLGANEDASAGIEPTPVRSALVRQGARASDELLKVVRRGEPARAAQSAAWVLGETRPDRVDDTVVPALRRGVLAPAFALHALNAPSSLPVVLEFLVDDNPATRQESRRAAARILKDTAPDGRAVDPIAIALQNTHIIPEERAELALLLGKTGSPRAAASLVRLLSTPALRVAAIDALGNVPSDETDRVLLSELSTGDGAARLHAAAALQRIGGPLARRGLLDRLERDAEVDRQAALIGLAGTFARLDPDKASDQRVVDLLGAVPATERDPLLEALGRSRSGTYVRFLAGDAPDRRTLASALGARGSAAAPDLRKLLADRDSSVRAQAAWSLGAAGDASVVAELARAAADADTDVAVNAAGALARIAGRTKRVEALCPLLESAAPWARSNALVGLWLAGRRCGDGALERRLLLSDRDEGVRIAAARAIGRGGDIDRRALGECLLRERVPRVAAICRADAPETPPGKNGEPTLIFVVHEGVSPKPSAPYALSYSSGLVRVGLADRRGAVFEALPPGETITLAPGR